MNSKDFIQSLRKIIREEVQVAVRSELTKFATVLSESKQASYIKTINPSEKKSYSNNMTLNDILHDTSSKMSTNGSQRSLLEQIDYNDFSEWPDMKHRAMATPAVITDLEGRTVNMQRLSETEAGAAVVNALTKDYRSLMKAIDKKKGN